VLDVAFAGDRTLVTAGTEGTLKFWHVPTGSLLLTLKPGIRVTGMALSPDGKVLATNSVISTRAQIDLWYSAER
jgi:WD40 repeat protein